MIEPLQVRPDEGKGLRLFQLDIDAAELKRLQTILKAAEPGLAAGRLADLLGCKVVDATRIEIFDIADLESFGLFNYLVKANGLPEAALAPDRAQIEMLAGVVLILYGRAFHNTSVVLAPKPPLRFVGAWDEDLPPLEFTPLRAESSKGILSPPTPRFVGRMHWPRWLWLLVTCLIALGLIALIAALKGAVT